MAEKKITKVQKFEAIGKALEGIEVKVDGEVINVAEFVAHEVELLQKKASGKSKKESEEAKALATKVQNALTSEARTVTDIIKGSEELAGLSTQKVSPVLTKLVKDGFADKVTEKGKNLYKLI